VLVAFSLWDDVCGGKKFHFSKMIKCVLRGNILAERWEFLRA